ncbi:peptidylprolyl isomerase [Mesonia sp. MT50]|uniref:peptidylprolyl isomerase n=1 Tax=Mesonia profundi TaxID=3070998 RepID=A0ABU0ZYA2_9FLAO|nr:peptidylprolyl isomerase [Mesonia profundi]MDQ7916447.1 peptidylprolyl isomerase [Mesonia profundi]
MKKHTLLVLLITSLSLFACNDKYPDLEDGMYAEFVTSEGTFVAELYYQKAPLTVANFVALAEGNQDMVDTTYKGKKFYNGLTFHRIIKGFMIQGGDPKGTGAGGPGYKFPDEFDKSLTHKTKGMLSMANAGPGTNGSQFFITLGPTPHLDNMHSVFGKIVVGQDKVDTIGNVKTGQGDKPVDAVTLKEVNIIRIGDDAKAFNAPKVFKSSLNKAEEAQKEAQQEAEAEKTKAKEAIDKEINTMAEGYTKTESGLRYKITTSKKTGATPERGQTVRVHYTGMLTDGTKFDSSYDRDRPLVFPVGVGKVIPGWDEGIRLLKVGEKAKLIIPPYLGYGERGNGPIPPNSILLFDVELVGIGQE